MCVGQQRLQVHQKCVLKVTRCHFRQNISELDWIEKPLYYICIIKFRVKSI